MTKGAIQTSKARKAAAEVRRINKLSPREYDAEEEAAGIVPSHRTYTPKQLKRAQKEWELKRAT